jgi:hypothetical protein
MTNVKSALYINEQAVKRGLHATGKYHSPELVRRLNAAVSKLIAGIGKGNYKRIKFVEQGLLIAIVEADGAVMVNI